MLVLHFNEQTKKRSMLKKGVDYTKSYRGLKLTVQVEYLIVIYNHLRLIIIC